jgi:predicted  nucleic acid-binding Zn-ribbon protein
MNAQTKQAEAIRLDSLIAAAQRQINDTQAQIADTTDTDEQEWLQRQLNKAQAKMGLLTAERDALGIASPNTTTTAPVITEERERYSSRFANK